MQAYFDSREAKFKTPFGAIKPHEEVYLTFDIWDGTPRAVFLRLLPEGESEQLILMDLTARPGGYTASCKFSWDRAQLLWYGFEFTDDFGRTYYYGPKSERTGGIGESSFAAGGFYQLTVSNMEDLPAWYTKSIVYQIFPDRFARESSVSTEFLNAKLVGHEHGPKRVVVDWDFPLRYDRNKDNSIKTWDFYGGSLKGILGKLDYLAQLGISCIYLNPIFEAASNHRYDTGDYERIDILLGLEEDFKKLCSEAKDRGISIILDGVFNHTGCDSKYFNKYDNYPNVGAYQSKESFYRDWYNFTSEDEYESWWGVKDLPSVNENNPEYQAYIYKVVQKWLGLGARGFRLDVADELPDSFIALLRKAVKEAKPDAILLGEVWEDASNKISYSERRKYFLGEELDCVMNYPFTDGLLNYLTGKIKAHEFSETLYSLLENYPKAAFSGNLNLLGSHDRMRVLTYLGDVPNKDALTEKERGEYKLSEAQLSLAKTRFWLANVVQMTSPGVPSIYYGDEAGLMGYTDPFNRGTYPWGKEDADCKKIVQENIEIRKTHPIFTDGSFEPLNLGEKIFGFVRKLEGEAAIVLVNADVNNWNDAFLPKYSARVTELLGHAYTEVRDAEVFVSLPPLSAAIIYFGQEQALGKIPTPGKGVLCHITSLPGGTFGKTCFDFLQYLHDQGFNYWQILPLNPTDAGGSPYSGSSAFAGNLKLLGLSEEQLQAEWTKAKDNSKYFAFFNNILTWPTWLKKFTMFESLKKKYHGAHWWEWATEHRTYSEELWLDDELALEAEFHAYAQLKFNEAWSKIRTRANELGISIIGDLPMFVAADSCDCWSEPEIFALEGGRILKESGAPPDYFNPKGQLWGSPVFNWQALKEKDYAWWLDRLERAFYLYDYVRLDHFRGFVAYWETEAGNLPTTGKWVSGPGYDLFKKAYDKFGPLPIIAEDLGKITPGVRLLLKSCGFYGMDVLQFANTDPRLYDYNPPDETIAYSGTHDNATLVGWCLEALRKAEAEKSKALDNTSVEAIEKTGASVGAEDSNLVEEVFDSIARVEGEASVSARAENKNEALVNSELELRAKLQAKEMLMKLWNSSAPIKIAPLQDLLGLGDEARMNTPGTIAGNWSWQAEDYKFNI